MMTDTRIPRSARLAGLDGLRAIAVVLVIWYHLFPASVLHNGFLGVDVFFVISGFLITTLLLDEVDATGRIGLAAFWRRRARRLVPALLLLLMVCATAAWVIGGDVLVGVGTQLLGAATFSYNWLSLATGGAYFDDATPELFRNLWSLAVEEQFYVLWPLLLPLFLLLPRAVRGVVAVLAAAGSAAWMGALVANGGDLTRAYFGTDSHAFGLLLGVAVAFGLRTLRQQPPAWAAGRAARGVALGIGILALVGLVTLAALPPITAGAYPGLLAGASMLTAVAIMAGVWPGSWFGRAIDVAPLRWIGDRSYGLYLWHWPLVVLLMAAIGAPAAADIPFVIGAVALALTIVIAEISYRFVEAPVRRHGFRGSLRALRRMLAGTPVTRFAALALVAAAALGLGGTSAAIAAAPSLTSAEEAVQAGQAALDRATSSPTATPGATPGATLPATPGATLPATPGPSAAPTPQASFDPSDPNTLPPSPTPVPVSGAEITAVGDSVMLASAGALVDRLPGISVDAKVSRSMWTAPRLVSRLKDAGKLRPNVVLALGTNGPVDDGVLREVLHIIGPERRLILVNAYAPRSWIPGVNRDLAAFAADHPRVSVADWSAAIAPHTDLLAGDDIHPGAGGGRVFADTVATAVDEAQLEEAREAYREAVVAYREARRYDEMYE